MIRWQLVGNMDLISNWDIQTYNAWLETKLQDIDQVIPTCEKLGLRLIVDLHSPVGGVVQAPRSQKYRLFTDSTFADAFVQNWQSISARYASQNIILGYDLLNEPLTQASSPWNALAPQAAQAIRDNDQIKTIIVECVMSTPAPIASLKPLTGFSNVWYSVHMYVPSPITFQGLPDAHGNIIPIGAPYPSDTVTKQKLIDALAPVVEFQTKNNATMYIGEFSCARWAGYPNCGDCLNYLTDCIDIFEGHGWNWTYHAYREAGVWNVEFSTTPCPNLQDPNCVEPYQNTDRKQLLINSFKKNQE